MTVPDGVVQGTVSEFDEATRDGAVLLDDGRALDFRGSAVAPELVRLRAGQRVQLRVVAGDVVAVTLLSLPLV